MKFNASHDINMKFSLIQNEAVHNFMVEFVYFYYESFMCPI